MAIDLIRHIKLWFSQFSTTSSVGELIANPISLAFIMVFVICLIVYFTLDASISFKFVFYLLMFTIGLLLLNQNINNQRFEEKLNKDQIANIPILHSNMVEFGPRSVDNLPEYVNSFQGSANMNGGGRNFTGYNNLVSINQVPNVTSSDDLLRFVQNA